MNIKNVKLGVQKVRVKATGHTFNLSCVKIDGLIGLAAFPIGDRAPRRGRHLLIEAGSREAWLNELEAA